MRDRLASLLQRFELRARVFYTGPLCRDSRFDAADGVGHVHVLRRGAMYVESAGRARREVRAPALVFYLQPTTHRLRPSAADAEIVCGSIDFCMGSGNPLGRSLPQPVVIPLAGEPGMSATLELLVAEARGNRCGRQSALDRLCELLVIQLLRHLMERGEAEAGLLAGLADARLARALNAMHLKPASGWTLAALARLAGMSRARFAVNFRDTVGETPGGYLARWRLGLAQSLLRRGKPVGLIAEEVGYSGPPALARAFSARFGASPTAWLKQAGRVAPGDGAKPAAGRARSRR